MAATLGLPLTRVSAFEGKSTPEVEREAVHDATFRRNPGRLELAWEHVCHRSRIKADHAIYMGWRYNARKKQKMAA